MAESFIKTLHSKVSKVTARRVDMAQKLQLQSPKSQAEPS